LIDNITTRWLGRKKSHRPVHQVEVEIGDVEVREGLFKSGPDVFRLVCCVPEFAGEPVFASGGAGACRAVEGGADVGFIVYMQWGGYS
jgi:hypothetical protein